MKKCEACEEHPGNISIGGVLFCKFCAEEARIDLEKQRSETGSASAARFAVKKQQYRMIGIDPEIHAQLKQKCAEDRIQIKDKVELLIKKYLEEK